MPQPVQHLNKGTQRQTPPAKFGGFGPGAVSHFIADTAGVYAPKAITKRTWPHMFEETFLELVEDVSFYFMLPLLGMAGLGKVFGRLAKANASEIERIGIATPQLLKKFAEPLSKNLVGAKAGMLLAGLALAGGYEYLITPVRNMLTARWFGAKNFTAVAGLEKARMQVKNDEVDPVAKGKKRIRQVGIITGALLGASLVLPKLIRSSSFLENGFRKVLKFVDFGGTVDKTGKLVNGYDISKGLLALVIGSGVVSYIDSARDSLERKETIGRLGLVVPYLLFGKELLGNLIAKVYENTTVGKHTPDAAKIKDLVQFRTKGFGQMLKDARKSESFLDFNAVKGQLIEEVDQLQGKITPEMRSQILKRFDSIGMLKFAFSFIVMGIGLNLTNYYFTRQRFKEQKLEEQRDLIANIPPKSQPTELAAVSNFAANPFLASNRISPAVYSEPVINPMASGVWRSQSVNVSNARPAVSAYATGIPAQRPLVRSAIVTGS